MPDIKKYAVIVAGGKSTRMGKVTPKQFLSLLGKPLLFYSINAFIKAFPDIQIILVLPEKDLSYKEFIMLSFPGGVLNLSVVAGGETRYQSVQNGLNAINDECVIFIHDGARPLVSVELIKRCYEQAQAAGNAVPAIPVTESIRLVEEDRSLPINRDQLRIIQTPQTFHSEIIKPAFGQPYNSLFTDEATVVEAAGINVHLIHGEQCNIKVTTHEDIAIAEALLKVHYNVKL